ncbi:zinc finger protein 513 isoform X2 [Protopterus annectens]|uniref:zinc finger protein 513 isoform X2 n=1 Tax=Protopterus annectens TaxID=7888 RepID=UPI001CF961B7|nr:zinc finger protein 513 isoform X2 [Protopterus annectens]
MPRRKQSNPQPVKLDSEDGLPGNTAGIILESDLLLGQDLEFEDNDDRIMGFEKDSEDSLVGKIGIPAYSLSDDECPSYRQLSVESETEDPADTEREDDRNSTLHIPFSCRQCDLMLDTTSQCPDGEPGYGCPRCNSDSSSQQVNASQGIKNKVVYSCNLCSFVSYYSNHVKRHMKTHNGEKPYKCSQCSYASSQLVNLQRHMRTHTGEKPFKCEWCEFACSSLGNLKRHKRVHTQEKPFKCGLCEYRCNQSRNLKRHMLSHKKELPSLSKKLEVIPPDLTLHMNGSDNFLPSCTRMRTDMEPLGLLDPVNRAEESDTLPELLFPFTCRMCGLVLDDGFTQEEGVAEQICARCSLDVLSVEAMGTSAKGDKAFSCTLCSFATHYPNHLVRHMKTHSGEKPYKCSLCSYASAHFDNLKRHQRIHTGEKPYKCEMCDYACGNLANLKRHERIHSGDKPFKCNICNYCCNQSMNLKRHMLRHTGEKPFRCEECSYTTGHWDNYKRHQKIHGHSVEGWTNPHSTRLVQ